MTLFAVARCRPRLVFLTRQLTIQAHQRSGLRVGAALLTAFACTASAYLFLPSTQSRAAPEQLSVQHFTPSTVIASEDASQDTKLITLRVNPALIPTRLLRHSVSASRIYSVFVKDSDIQVERPYTPLECADMEGRMKFWVKKYEKGEVGRWLHARKVGDVVELRGPELTWDWSWRPSDDEWDEVVMISGGTGITPFYQFLHSIFAYPSKDKRLTRYTLLHGSRTPADLPPPAILDPLTQFASERPDIFKMHFFVDSMSTGSTHAVAYPSSLEVGRIGRAAIERGLGPSSDNRSWWSSLWKKREETLQKRILFLVCGPEPMINAISGPYGRNFSQGSVGGILGEMGYTSREVWKL
ncbi:hypothetical protein APHAL10511_002120 [Amanita phalloides]|nr:hypothetical protein APHAL10511_002120 [Amanita phalloides]